MVSIRARLTNSLLRWTMKRPMRSMTDYLYLRQTTARMERINSFVPMSKDISMEDVDAGGVVSQFIRVPSSKEGRTILYFHGGGFVTSSPRVHTRLLARFCRELDAQGLMVDYRLAPEHPFPAGSDDCLSAYKWLLAQGHNPRNIVIAGDSAGANLALVTAIRIRDEELTLPGCVVMLSAGTDFSRTRIPSHTENAEKDPGFMPHSLDLIIEAYLGDGTPKTHPHVSPLYADMHGLPPLLFHAGSTEILRDDSIVVAEKAKAAGVDVTCKIWEDMPHVFHVLDYLPETRQAFTEIKNFVQAKMNWHDSQPL